MCILPGSGPLAYETLAFQVHLEPLSFGDTACLTDATAEIEGWIGSRLRWARGSMLDACEPYLTSHLDYIAGYPNLLVEECDPAEPEQERIAQLLMSVARVEDYGLSCGGSALAQHKDAQTVGLRFFADVERVMPEAIALAPHAVLRVTVPSSEPLDAFAEHCTRLARVLPVRWASAGLFLSGAEVGARWSHWKRVARSYTGRHWGVDHGEHVGLVAHFYDWIRSVNWLTWLGPTMVRDLGWTESKPVSTDRVSVTAAAFANGEGLLLRAGDAPERGDMNRLQLPTAYAEADSMVRRRRSLGEDLTFFGAWTKRTTREWLRRFEKTVSA